MFYFVGLALAWGPVFHQAIATEFASEYLPHLTDEQKRAFIHGSVFIDGLPKFQSHDLEWIKKLLNRFENNTNEWWFTMGFAIHMAVDVAGHMGEPLAFLPLKSRLGHYFAELSVCSAILKTTNLEFLQSYDVSNHVYQEAFGISSRRFAILYRIWRKVASYPVHRFINHIEGDNCKGNHGLGLCNLRMHMRTIKGIMWDSLCALMTGDFTAQHLGNMARRQLARVKCCA